MTHKTCPDCGANLDPGEVCDCQWANLRRRCHAMVDQITDPALIERAKRFLTYLYVYRDAEEKDRPGATNTETARADKTVTKTI